ncbi:hypothetical protein WICMUC_003033 [Wickerhamomyces mucosus]|uniref:Small ribosomal subunit protein uS5m n=1 Tax=Wickerhamomyces mucosus TaxID=1378264 RepID=A0A9P8PNM4_9ASCO|nr:hypothetical protein WICMUC_003033 [Wickerhamomyces mucosus]
MFPSISKRSSLINVKNVSSIRLFSNCRSLLNESTNSSSPSSSKDLKNNKITDEAKDSHLNFLRNYYSDELLESIKLAESFVNPKHFAEKKLPRTEFSPPYLDDFSKRDQFWDNLNVEDPAKIDFRYQLQQAKVDVPPGSIIEEASSTRQNSVIAKGLSLLTGLNAQYIERLNAKPLVMKRVSNQTAKGKIPTNYALVVVGDKNGMVGIGEGKDRVEMSRAVSKAHWNAVKNLRFIPRHEDRTIVGTIDHRFHGSKIFLRSAPPGFGLRVNHYIFEICQLIGIKDLSAKIYKSRNPMNVCKGFIESLSNQQSLEELSLNRGKKIVDIRKTYYSAEPK